MGTKLPPPLSPPNLTTNTQACSASVQVSSGAKYEEIYEMSRHKVAPIGVQESSTNDPMVVLQAKGIQKSSRNIFIRAAAYDAVWKQTIIPIQ